MFGMGHQEALLTIEKSFCEDSEGTQASAATHRQSVDSYVSYLEDFKHVNAKNKNMDLMRQNNVDKHLNSNRKAFRSFATSAMPSKKAVLMTAFEGA